MKKRNGFKCGFCRALDLGAKSKRMLNVTERDNDYNVLAWDWENVSRDIRTAVGRYDFRECR